MAIDLMLPGGQVFLFLMGNFGSFEKLDRTVIGEAVNIASRLEAKTKMYNLEVVVTEEIVRARAFVASR